MRRIALWLVGAAALAQAAVANPTAPVDRDTCFDLPPAERIACERLPPPPPLPPPRNLTEDENPAAPLARPPVGNEFNSPNTFRGDEPGSPSP